MKTGPFAVTAGMESGRGGNGRNKQLSSAFLRVYACLCLNGAMLAAERRHAILDRLRSDGKVVAAELSASLAVSPDTVRRDLSELADAGLLRRVHGGALPPTVGAQTYTVRSEQAPEAKAAIAQATSALLRPGQVILLDSGTTTLEVARRLPLGLEATVITNSPPIAVALAEHPTVDVTVLGGMLDKEARAIVGAATIETLRSIRADVLVLGVCSLHPDVGITVNALEESYVKRAMIANAAEVVAVSSGDKLGSAGPYVVGPLDELTHLVTEDSVPPAQLAPYRALGIEVVLA
jgi:DeoR/GlpR family transcriptional regulator of sugar metabolism